MLFHGRRSNLASTEKNLGEFFINWGFRNREEGEIGLRARWAKVRRWWWRREAMDMAERRAFDAGNETVRRGSGGKRVFVEFEATRTE